MRIDVAEVEGLAKFFGIDFFVYMEQAQKKKVKTFEQLKKVGAELKKAQELKAVRKIRVKKLRRLKKSNEKVEQDKLKKPMRYYYRGFSATELASKLGASGTTIRDAIKNKDFEKLDESLAAGKWIRGVGGRPTVVPKKPEHRPRIINIGMTAKEIRKLTGASKATIYRAAETGNFEQIELSIKAGEWVHGGKFKEGRVAARPAREIYRGMTARELAKLTSATEATVRTAVKRGDFDRIEASIKAGRWQRRRGSGLSKQSEKAQDLRALLLSHNQAWMREFIKTGGASVR